MIAAGSRVYIQKGCNARNVARGVSAVVESVTPLGAEYSHACRVVFRFINGFRAGQVATFFARHPNRLADPVVNLNDGNPRHSIQVIEMAARPPRPRLVVDPLDQGTGEARHEQRLVDESERGE